MSKKCLLALLPILMLASCEEIPSIPSIPLPSDESESSQTIESSSSETSSSTSEPTSSSSEKEPEPQPSGPSYEIPTAPLSGYYKDIDVNARGAELLSQTRQLIVSTHKKYTTYNENRGPNSGGLVDRTDYDPDVKGHIIMFYARASISETWDSGKTWNREHVWPQSLSSKNWGTSGGGADMHHLRPSFNKVNGARGNKKYGVANGGSIYKYTYKNKTYECAKVAGDIWEPLDNLKGDVARIILYTFTHYNKPSNLEKNDNLTGAITSTANSWTQDNSMPITNVIQGSVSSAFKLLAEWNRLDPVDDYELRRNEGVFKIQGNRNAFIDHPWLVDAIWG